jgi:large conductance mechanosensitive channel
VIESPAPFIFIVKFLGWLVHARKQKAAAPPLTKDQDILAEIRDLLKQREGAA